MTNLVTLAKDLNEVKNQYDAARRTLLQKQEHLYKQLVRLVTDIGNVWQEMEPGVRERIFEMAGKTNFKFNQVEYDVDNFDEIVWSIGNQFPVYNESCEPIVGYPLLQSTANVSQISVIEQETFIKVTVAFTNMDGFEIIVDNDFADAYFHSDTPIIITRKYLTDKIENTYVSLQEYFEKNGTTKVSQSDSAARMKRLQEEAAALGLRLVSDK